MGSRGRVAHGIASWEGFCRGRKSAHEAATAGVVGGGILFGLDVNQVQAYDL